MSTLVTLPPLTSAIAPFSVATHRLVWRSSYSRTTSLLVNPGVLFSSGLIAGGAIVGVGIAALQAIRKDDFINVSHWLGAGVTSVTENAIVAVAVYVLFLAVPLYRVARRPSA